VERLEIPRRPLGGGLAGCPITIQKGLTDGGWCGLELFPLTKTKSEKMLPGFRRARILSITVAEPPALGFIEPPFDAHGACIPMGPSCVIIAAGTGLTLARVSLIDAPFTPFCEAKRASSTRNVPRDIQVERWLRTAVEAHPVHQDYARTV
jgi:hypothetical protein